jgi:hypothetical protein
MRRPYRWLPALGARPLTPQQQVLADWRGIDLSPAEAAVARPAKTMGAVVPRVLSGLGLERRQAEAEIVRVWNHVLDPNLTAHAQPVRLHKGTLFVKVTNSAWLSEIVRYRRKEILERLHFSFGRDLVQRISFQAG